MNQRMKILEVIESKDFMVLDTETTGLGSGAEIVSIAIIDAHGNTHLDTLVKPVRPIPPDATRIHGITNEMVSTAEPLPLYQIRDLLAGRHVIVYNADYDLGMLYKSAKASNLPFVEWSDITLGWHCAMQTFAEIYGDWNDYHQSYRWQKLSTACSYYRIPVVGAHGALADCLMTLKVCEAMLKSHTEAAK